MKQSFHRLNSRNTGLFSEYLKLIGYIFVYISLFVCFVLYSTKSRYRLFERSGARSFHHYDIILDSGGSRGIRWKGRIGRAPNLAEDTRTEASKRDDRTSEGMVKHDRNNFENYMQKMSSLVHITVFNQSINQSIS